MSRYLHVALALLVGYATPVAAQQEEPRQVLLQEPVAPQTFITVRGFSSDYEVGPGDLLDIQIIGQDDMRQSLRVSNSGEISVPLLGQVRVLDMTAFEIEDTIARLLRESGLVKKPDVLISVAEYQAKPIFILGAVTTPGQFVMSQALTAADAILMAGGLRFNAGDEALLHRRTSATDNSTLSPAAVAANPGVAHPGAEIIRIDLRPLKEGRFHESDVQLRRGDVLVVPDRALEQFFVVGEVLVPRNYLYTPGKKLMASQAISWAGGPTTTAKMSEGMLVRFDEQGQRTEIKVDWAAVLRGKQQDFPIQSNDIIFIPGSAVKTIAQGLLMLTDTMVMTSTFRIARSYQLTEPAPPPVRAVPPPQ